MTLPSKAEVGTYIDDLKNWGRWGPDDQLGTLNLIQPEHRTAAARLVTEGRTISCARDLVTAYGTNVTHIDSVAHLFWKGELYNGKSSRLVTSEHGAIFGAVTAMSDGIVGRGVLLDVPRAEGVDALAGGKAVTPADLEATAAAQGVAVGPGDIVLLRTGRWAAEDGESQAKVAHADPHDDARRGLRAGWHPACMPWFREREVAVIGCDGPQEPLPPPYPTVPGAMIHVYALYAMGMPLIDNCDLEELAAVCAELGRWEFQFLVTPLRVVGGSGSPVNPVAVF